MSRSLRVAICNVKYVKNNNLIGCAIGVDVLLGDAQTTSFRQCVDSLHALLCPVAIGHTVIEMYARDCTRVSTHCSLCSLHSGYFTC